MRLGKEKVNTICQDNYCKGITWEIQTDKYNFDQPNAIDKTLFEKQLIDLNRGKNILMPVYDHDLHSMTTRTVEIQPKLINIIEGTLILQFGFTKKLLDICMYIEIPDLISLNRRISRDTYERGRSIPEITSQYRKQVLSMQKKYIESVKYLADHILDGTTSNASLVEQASNIVGEN